MVVWEKKLLLETLAEEGPMSASELAISFQTGIEEAQSELEDLLNKELLTVVRDEPTAYYALSKKGKRLALDRKRAVA